MAVSGELRYFGPAFSSVESVRPVKAMTFPASLAMGNITRLRNLEYMFIAVLSLQPITQQKPGIRRKPDAKAPDRLLIQPPPSQILPRPRPLRPAQAFLKESTGALVDIKQHRSQLGFFRLGRAAKAGFRERYVQLLRDRSHRLRKGNVLYFLHEAEHIARRPAPETVKELPRGMHRERRRLLAMKRTQPRKILRPRLLQLDVIAHHADDIRLLLERVREIARVGHGWSGP